jgi:murein DD-endopeptidase MepM/ murein hydrolase activator NlpD
MAKEKFHYDSETLTYVKVKVKTSDKIKRFLMVVTAVGLVAFMGYIGFSQLFESPREKEYKRELENLTLHYDLLDKKMNQVSGVLNELAERDNNIYRVYFEVNPIPKEQRKAGFGGVNRYKSLEGFNNSEMIIEASKKLDILSKQLVIQSKSLDEIVKLAKNKEEMLASIPAIMPVEKGKLLRMASGYGMRMHPILKIRKMHEGMDFSAKRGTPIFASGNGKIIRANRSSTYGNVIYIDHGYGYETRYAHMNKFAKGIRKGKKVKRGDLIGYVGNTGRSVAPHLHYEVLYKDRHVNPIDFYFGNLSAEEFAAIQEASMQEGQSLER